MKHSAPYSLFRPVYVFFVWILCTLSGYALDFPLDFHGSGFLGKYLNSDTTRYNMDASIEIYCTLVQHRGFSFYIRYRDDLDMAEQTGGVSLDPRYAHYYIIGGFDYTFPRFMLATYFVHDCVHDIDYDIEGTPVFNRIRLQCADINYHVRNRFVIPDRFSWNIELGYYPHVQYHGWDVNSGADYQYEAMVTWLWEIFRHEPLSVALKPSFLVTRGDSSWYHQHVVSLTGYYTTRGKRIGLDLSYNIWNNDPIKDPDRLWLLSLYIAF